MKEKSRTELANPYPYPYPYPMKVERNDTEVAVRVLETVKEKRRTKLANLVCKNGRYGEVGWGRVWAAGDSGGDAEGQAS